MYLEVSVLDSILSCTLPWFGLGQTGSHVDEQIDLMENLGWNKKPGYDCNWSIKKPINIWFRTKSGYAA